MCLWVTVKLTIFRWIYVVGATYEGCAKINTLKNLLQIQFWWLDRCYSPVISGEKSKIFRSVIFNTSWRESTGFKQEFRRLVEAFRWLSYFDADFIPICILFIDYTTSVLKSRMVCKRAGLISMRIILCLSSFKAFALYAHFLMSRFGRKETVRHAFINFNGREESGGKSCITMPLIEGRIPWQRIWSELSEAAEDWGFVYRREIEFSQSFHCHVNHQSPTIFGTKGGGRMCGKMQRHLKVRLAFSTKNSMQWHTVK